MSDVVRYGIIGSGMMGHEHIRNIALVPGAEVVAVSDPVRDSRWWAQQLVEHELDEYEDHRDLLKSARIDAVVIATGNDWRGVEAGAHAYAARSGSYRSLSRFWRHEGSLYGELELPMAVATVGGSTQVHPTVMTLKKILGVQSARELAQVCVAVGLAQNLGALKALATEGIQRGHMSLHARSVALAVGARSEEVPELSRALIERGHIKRDVARELLAKLRGQS